MNKITVCDSCEAIIEENEQYKISISKRTGNCIFNEESGDLCPACVQKVKTLLFPSKEASVTAPASEPLG